MSGVWMCLCVVCACPALVCARDLVCPLSHYHVCRAADENNNKFILHGKEIIYSYKEDKVFKMYCIDDTALDSADLPRFTTELKARWVTVVGCSMPGAGGSVSSALAAFNVSLDCVDSCLLRLGLRLEEELRAAHLAALDQLVGLYLYPAFMSLEIHTDIDIFPERLKKARPRLTCTGAEFHAAIPSLRYLKVESVQVSGGALSQLPQGLTGLSLYDITEQADLSNTIAAIAENVTKPFDLNTIWLAFYSASAKSLYHAQWTETASRRPRLHTPTHERLMRKILHAKKSLRIPGGR